MTNSTKKKPVDTIRFGRISAAIWENESDKGIFYNFTVERNYSTADGPLQTTSSFNASHTLTLAKICDLVHTRIFELLQADKKAEQ